MYARTLPILAAALVAAAVGAAPAAAQTPTDHPAPGALPGACADQSAPASAFTRRAARRARRTRLLRGTATDLGCGLDRVEISVLRRHGKRCRPLTARGRLARRTSCTRLTWLPVRGASRWSFRLPKRLPAGAYRIRTRAFDFAGNVERPHGRRVKLAKRRRGKR